MTGRKGRVVCTDEGINYESRSEADVPLEILNLTEKQRFMDGEKVSWQSLFSSLQCLTHLIGDTDVAVLCQIANMLEPRIGLTYKGPGLDPSLFI